MLNDIRVRELLTPFRPELSAVEVGQLRLYLDLLLRWNEKINLTAIREPEECVTRHFGESLFLASQAELRGALLDVGSGAGFPGLALKIACPDLAVTLLEPVAKKRAFLKEATRVCGFSKVDVRPERLEDFAPKQRERFDVGTSRAVGKLERLAPLTAQCLKPGGRIFLWLTREQAANVRQTMPEVGWRDPLPIPLSRSGVILPGEC